MEQEKSISISRKITANRMAPYPQQGRASGAATPQNDLNNSGAQWAFDLPLETVANYVIDIDNVTGDLAEPPIHASAVNTVHPNDFASQGRRPSGATLGSNCNSRRKFNDEEVRQRRTERQRHYRERQRQGEADMKKNINVTAAEIKAELLQQDALLAERTALTKASEYCASTLSAAQSLVSNTIDIVRSECNHAIEGLAWLSLQVHSPSDAQLHAFLARRDLNELDDMSEKVTKRCIDLLNRWNDEPESREHVEAQIEKIQNIRLRCLTYLAATRPEIVVELNSRRLIPVLPDGAPNPKLVEAVAALELTPEQLESLEREWVLYLQKTESVRQEARSSLSFLASSGADESAAAFCSIGAAGLFLDRLQAVKELETHPAIESSAIAKLSTAFAVNLTSQQKTTLMKLCMPFYPDAIQICRIVFGDTQGNDADAASIQSLPASES